MSFDRKLLGEKIKKYREQFEVSIPELSKATGISIDSLVDYEKGNKEPSGDEILILADHFKCDYKFFISNERVAPFEQTETLFRRYNKEFSKEDRWAVQEVLFLAESEFYLQKELGFNIKRKFSFEKKGTYYKGHGADAAAQLRHELGYLENQIPLDIYDDFRKIGIHVFRRKLSNPNISGLYIKHPTAGKCILINYNEDIYRQRFTAAHEAGHSILDDDQDVVVSFTNWNKGDLSEIRANTFASHYLLPPKFLESINTQGKWDTNKTLLWANKLKVSTSALANTLKEYKLIDGITENQIKSVRVPSEAKVDPEIGLNLSPKAFERKKTFLKLGLSSSYVKLCFNAYRANIISAARMAEMLLVNEVILNEIANLYGEEIQYGN